MDLRNFHKLMAPRLTVLVTTMDEKGRPDVSPFSFVSPISFDPPLIMLAIGMNKHSYWSISRKQEIVVNIPTEKILDKLWVAGQSWSPDVSKLERAGLATEKSEKVAPPRLSECVASLECYVENMKKWGDHVMIIARVVALRVDEDFLDQEGRLRVDLVRPPLHVSDNVFAFPYVTKTVG